MRVVAVALCVAALSAPTESMAQSETPPARIGIVGGVRQHLGDVGELYGFGWLLGVDAGYQPPWFPVGIMWTVLRGEFGSDEPSNVDSDLTMLEMTFGFHGRLSLSDTAVRHLTLGTGVAVLRSENALPPDNKRSFVGPYVALGYEQYLAGRYLVGLETRYGLLFGGPRGVTMNLSIHFGNR